MRAWVLVVLLLTGCPPGLDFDVLEAGAGDASADGAPADATLADGARPDRAMPPPDCPLPHLYVMLADLDGATRPGRVVRLALGADGSVTRCSDLTGTLDTGTNMIPEHPFSAALLRPDRLIVAAQDRVAMVDPTANDVIWQSSIGYGDSAFEAARVMGTDGQPRAVLAIDRRLATGFEVRDVFVWSADSPEARPQWNVTAEPLLVGLGITAMTADPADPTHVLMLKSNSSDNAAALDVPLPFDGSPTMESVRVPYPPDTRLETLYAYYDGREARYAWVGKRFSEMDDGVFYSNGSRISMLGPSRCAPSDCRSPLDLRHAVSDPTLNTRLIAVCEDGGTRRVIRFSTSGGACEELLGPADMEPRYIVERLAVAPAM